MNFQIYNSSNINVNNNDVATAPQAPIILDDFEPHTDSLAAHLSVWNFPVDVAREQEFKAQISLIVDAQATFVTKFPFFFNLKKSPFELLFEKENVLWDSYYMLAYHIIIQKRSANDPLCVDQVLDGVARSWIRKIWKIVWRVWRHKLSIDTLLEHNREDRRRIKSDPFRLIQNS